MNAVRKVFYLPVPERRVSDVRHDHLIAENNFLRRATLYAEATIGCAAAIVRLTGNVAEADQFERDATYLRLVRRIVTRELPNA